MPTDDCRIGIPEVICPVCGKTYIRAPYHLYKDVQRRYVCSWGCMLESERIEEAKAKARAEARRARRVKSKKTLEREAAHERRLAQKDATARRNADMMRMLREGMSVKEIAKSVGLSYSHATVILAECERHIVPDRG